MVFELHKNLPIAAMTTGMGHFGNASIGILAEELRLWMSREGSAEQLDVAKYPVDQVADLVQNFLGPYVRKDPRPLQFQTFSNS